MTDYHPQIHELKTHPKYFEMMRSGMKQFDLRKNDRNFRHDDLLILREWNPDISDYTGHVLTAVVTCVVSGEWLQLGYVALGVRVLR